ncbi:MAG: hypothetical protein RMJ35_04145, partial [Phycisphaerales bacterium]|nr:hypothetical protein [Phycisphaerales bacterium]
AGQNPKLAGAARLVIVGSAASPYEAMKQNDPLLSTTTARDAQGVRTAMEEARAKAGALKSDPVIATEYATRAAQLLQRLAISRGQVMDVAAARQSLLMSLEDTRPEIVKLVGESLALIDAPDAQAGLLTKALSPELSDDVRISLLKSLSTSAKFFGNKLDTAATEQLMKLVADGPSLEIRAAAAEAQGALNLPADQAKRLIIEQMRV